jgi:hypothetical protein
MTDNAEPPKPERSVQLAGVGLAILWVAASLWQQWSWTYVSPPAISCGQAGFVVFKVWAVVTTVIVVVVSAVFHLKVGVRPGHPERAGSVITGVGLGISLAIGLVPLFFIVILFTGLEGLGGPPPTATNVVNEVFLLAMYIGPPIAGIASLFVSHSEATLARMGRVNRARLSFAIAGGLSALSLVAAYAVVAVNCGNASWIVQ